MLERALKSILIQEVADLEILICDDRSEDKHWPTISALGLLDKRIRIHRNERNLGAVKNLNNSLDLARGEWILIFNDDDVMLPSMLLKEKEFIKNNPNIGFVYCDGFSVSSIGKKMLRTCPTKPILKAGEEALNHIVFHFNIFATCVLVNRKCYGKLGKWTDTVSPDWEMWSRIASQYDIGHINEPLIEVYLHNVSSSSPVSRYENDWVMLNKLVCSYYPVHMQKDLLPLMLTSMAEGFWSMGYQAWLQGDWLRGMKFMKAGRKYLQGKLWWYRFLNYSFFALPRRVKYVLTDKEVYESHV